MSSEFSWKAYQDMFESNGKEFIKTLPAFLGIFYLAVEQVTGKPELNHPHGQECMSWIASLPELFFIVALMDMLEQESTQQGLYH